jgi:hypothetical protein
MIGALISPLLVQMEETLLSYEANVGLRPCYSEDALRAAIKLFASILMDKMWSLQEQEGMSLEDRQNMATKCGEAIRHLVKVYTGIDTHEMYNA